MGRTLPTLSQSLTDSEAQLARFRRGLRKSDQYVFDGLFAAARRHVTAIGQTEALLPFEAVLLAMLLEQAKESALLQHEVRLLKIALAAVLGGEDSAASIMNDVSQWMKPPDG